MAYVVLNHTVVTRWSQDSLDKYSSETALSSSSNFTSILVHWQIRVLKTFKWSVICVPSFIRKLYKCLFKKILFDKFFVIYILSSLVHKHVVVNSSMMLNNISSARHKQIVLRDFASRSSQSSSIMLVGFFEFLAKAFCNPCFRRRSHILIFHSVKLLFPVNFGTSNLELYTFVITKKL